MRQAAFDAEHGPAAQAAARQLEHSAGRGKGKGKGAGGSDEPKEVAVAAVAVAVADMADVEDVEDGGQWRSCKVAPASGSGAGQKAGA